MPGSARPAAHAPPPDLPHTEAAAPLSVAIVCKDNALTLPRTLDAVKGLAAEILAVDSGSTDSTLDLLAAAGARVIHSPWLGHVKTKQLALDACSQPWVLCLDSDESPDADLLAAIRKAILPGTQGPAGFALRRVTWYRNRPLRFAWQPEWRLRLVRRGAAAWGGIDPHDQLRLTPSGPASRLQGTLRHDSFDSFRDHLAKQLAYSRLSAEGLHARGTRTNPWRMALAPSAALLKQLVLKQAWRDGIPGWLAAGSTAAGALMKHMILLELAHSSPKAADRP